MALIDKRRKAAGVSLIYDAWQKVANAPLTEFDPALLAGMKYSNRAGYMLELDRLFSTMYHEWPTLQKDLSDVAESVAMLDWSVSPAVDDGERPSEKAREVADVVSRALWARSAQRPGTFSHGFLELVESIVHGYYRGVNVHEIRWKHTPNLVFPESFELVWPQYYMWETRAGHADRLMMVPDGCSYMDPQEFPPHKFVIALNNGGPDHPMYNGVLYSLLGYFLAAKCGLPWLQDYVLRYGHPVRKFTVESKAEEEKLRAELEENDDLMDVFLRRGRELDITAIPAGANIPHEALLRLAENMCHQVILGQTLTSDASQNGGSRAQAQVHERVQNGVILRRAEFVSRLLNRTLVPDIVAMNYGEAAVDTLPLPELKCSLPDAGLDVDRVQVLRELMQLPGFRVAKSFVYEFLRIPMPTDGEEVFVGPAQQGDMGGAAALPTGIHDGGNSEREAGESVAAASAGQTRPPKSCAREHAAAAESLLPKVAEDWMGPVLDRLERMLDAGATPEVIRSRLSSMTPNTEALEQAFAAVFQSGLGVEADDDRLAAANPYGCNQYGEGWACPHNGNSTAYRDMSPFGKGNGLSKVLTNETGENTVDLKTDKKRVKKTDYPSALPSDLNQSAGAAQVTMGSAVGQLVTEIYNGVGKDHAELFRTQMDRAPREVQNFVKKYGSSVTVQISSRPTSYCAWSKPPSIYIYPNNNIRRVGTKIAPDGNCMLHELGHALDLVAGIPSKRLKKVIDADVAAVVESHRASCEEAQVEKAREILGDRLHSVDFSKWTSEAVGAMHELVRAGLMRTKELGTFFVKRQAPPIIRRARGESKPDGSPYPVYVKPAMLKDSVSRELKKLGFEPVLAICDAFGSKGMHALIGHSDSYYKRDRFNGCLETFANMFAAHAQNDTAALEMAKKYLPNVYEEFKLILAEAGKP